MERAVDQLVEGLSINSYKLFAERSPKARYAEEVNLKVFLRHGRKEAPLLLLKAFKGRKPFYRQWAEFYGVNSQIGLGRITIDYFGSIFEDALLRLFFKYLEPGGRIFVEYYEDAETANELESGFPPPVTRLGYKLFEIGFTWFKDWYFPEGFMEGGQKLQGEKPLNSEAKGRQLNKIQGEIKPFLEKTRRLDKQGFYVTRAIERANRILQSI